MSAAEIIELIKTVTPQEKAAVVAFLQDRFDGRVEEAAVGQTPRYIPLAGAQEIAEGIFDRHSELFEKLAQ